MRIDPWVDARPVVTRGAAPTSQRLPDAEAFVSAAQRISNERDADALCPLYAESAVFRSVTDGAILGAVGREEIMNAWRTIFGILAAHDIQVEKRLVVAAEDVIVNEWRSSPASHLDAVGIETWRFDEHGLVAEHQLDSYLDVKSAANPLQQLRMLILHPVLGLTLLRVKMLGALR